MVIEIGFSTRERHAVVTGNDNDRMIHFTEFFKDIQDIANLIVKVLHFCQVPPHVFAHLGIVRQEVGDFERVLIDVMVFVIRAVWVPTTKPIAKRLSRIQACITVVHHPLKRNVRPRGIVFPTRGVKVTRPPAFL